MDSLSSEIPDEFVCPITREIMKDPVIASGMSGDCQTRGDVHVEDNAHFAQVPLNLDYVQNSHFVSHK